MKEAAIPGYRLSKARFSTRVLTTLGMLGLLLGLLGAVLMTVARTGLTTTEVRQYYRGSAEDAPQDALADELTHTEPRPFNELAEVTHLHLMGGSLLLFLLCHLLSVCDVRDSTRTALYLVSFGSFLITFSLPWAIVYGSGSFARLFIPSIATLTASLFLLCVIPLREMWFVRRNVREHAA